MSQIFGVALTQPGTGTVTSVSGGNNITITGDPSINPTVNVSGTTNHSVLLGNATGSINSLANGTNGQVLTAVTGLDPVWAAAGGTGTVTSLTAATGITLTPNPITMAGTIGLTIPVVVTSGGTGAITLTNHGVLLGQGTAAVVATAVGATNTVLLGNTAADPSFGQVPNGALTNSSVTLNSGNNLTVTGGGPLSLGGVASFAVTGTTQNAVQIGSAAGALTSVALGMTNEVLLGNTASAPTWGLVPNAALVNNSITLTNGNNITITGSPVALGGAATVSVSGTTNNSLLYGNGTGSISSLGVATNGQIPIGSTGSTPVLGTITAGSNISVTNGAGSITIASTGGGITTITGDTGGALSGSNITFTGGSTGLLFSGASTTETLTGTLAIANGGTNATSMATSTGIVKYDGTSLVTSTTAKIDSSNRMTNTSQPAFLAYLTTSLSNVTGDGTAYTIPFNIVSFDQGSNFNTGTGVFNAPVDGIYYFSANLITNGINIAHTQYLVSFLVSGGPVQWTRIALNPSTIFTTSGALYLPATAIISLTASQTVSVIMSVSGSTKTVNLGGVVRNETSFSGYLIC